MRTRDRRCSFLSTMDIDPDKIDEAILALLYLTLHDGSRAWKGFEWEAMNRFTRRGSFQIPSARPNRCS
ncbi:MAG: hypothetical protein JO138_23645 [Acidobacteriaceae bacterium]|nr:hypothetical protein [Acidobacteriaceae bacterium]